MIKNEIKIKLKQYENKDFGAYSLPSFMGLATWMKTHLVEWEPNIHILIYEHFIHEHMNTLNGFKCQNLS